MTQAYGFIAHISTGETEEQQWVGIRSNSVTIRIVPGVPAVEEERTGPEVDTRSSIQILEGVV